MRYLLIALLLCGPVFAQDEQGDEDPGGVLNPDEMSLNRSLERALKGEVDMVICSQGYLMTKKGSHGDARSIFEACAARGWTGTMTWMSYMEQNGFGDDFDPDAAAEWDRRAAEAGDPVGMFNHGINLMRGFGIGMDDALGRDYVDRAAAAGLAVAKRLQRANYDLDVVTPDADNWRYAPAS